MGNAPYASEKYREKFKMNSFFIADNVREAFSKGIGDYTPIFLSEIPNEFESGRIPLDVALIICYAARRQRPLLTRRLRRYRQIRRIKCQIRHRTGQLPYAENFRRFLYPRQQH